ncbi:hypothetical protein [Gorillibacterium timonense]|uniref:hypothetical protein n=1 Tax=Gorillibacterium timonense TaxID=1689269 RepID=UPI00071C5C9B|nr:hypothetical protein [Gorillibacterium timonense]
MTLAAVFAAKNFAIAVADRRRTLLSSGVYVDDVKKIHQVNARVMVSWAGIYHSIGNGQYRGLAEQIINENLFRTGDESSVEEVAEMYSQSLKKRLAAGEDMDDLAVTFHLSGRDQSGKYAIARVSHFEGFQMVVTPSNDRGLIWSLSRADYDPSQWLQAEIASLSEVSVETIQALAVKLIERTAELDGYVSGTYDMLILDSI